MRWLNLLLGACFVFPGLSQAADPTIEELLDAVDDANRGDTSEGRMSMHVKTRRWERTMTMEMWSKGEDNSLVRIVAPAKEAGTATLRVGDNIWNYLPKVDRTMKVPAAMMSGNWMGSHFTNNDLVRGSRLADDFTFELTDRPTEDGKGHWGVSCVPKEDAPVVWGKVLVKVTADKVPMEVSYWDEDGGLVRTMTFHDVRDVDGQKVPMRIRMVPSDKPDEVTEMSYEGLRFNVEVPASTFTLQALKK